MGLAPAVLVHVGAAGHARRHGAGEALVAADEAPRVVAVTPVPLGPPLPGEAPDLVEARRVPRLGDDLRLLEDRVRLDLPEERRVLHGPPLLVPREDRREVEPEAVHVHDRDPVAERVEDHAPHERVVARERVPAPREVEVLRLVVLEEVVDRVLDPAKRDGGPALVALARVVEDHVEDDLDPGLVHGLDHVAEAGEVLHALPVLGVVAAVRREVADRVVAPEVRQALARVGVDPRVLVLVELVDRQELECRHAEILEVRDLLDEGVEGARVLRLRRRVAREAADVRLVDDRVRGVNVRRRDAFPVVVGEVHDEALHGRLAVVVWTRGLVPRPVLPVNDAQGVGVEEDLLHVEAVPVPGLMGSVDAIGVDLALADPLDEDVPVIEGLVDPRVEPDRLERLRVVEPVEEQQLDRGRALREEREVDSARGDARPERAGLTGSGRKHRRPWRSRPGPPPGSGRGAPRPSSSRRRACRRSRSPRGAPRTSRSRSRP